MIVLEAADDARDGVFDQRGCRLTARRPRRAQFIRQAIDQGCPGRDGNELSSLGDGLIKRIPASPAKCRMNTEAAETISLAMGFSVIAALYGFSNATNASGLVDSRAPGQMIWYPANLLADPLHVPSTSCISSATYTVSIRSHRTCCRRMKFMKF